ncbi:MAG: dienelactone hydrolase family protein [Proteobacteria bacterium]|nr:dienelactone hydrolase family protein [Pseudomonadota bacterium]
MGDYTTIMARDGHEFQAWLAAPPARPLGAVVVLQEIFGVNAHIRGLADGFAAGGYTAIAPCLFDRVRRGIELGYSAAEQQQGLGYAKQIPQEAALRDIAAAIAVVRRSGRTAAVGYCRGGLYAYLAAVQLPLACAVVYYGRVADQLGSAPRCPVQYHFGSLDSSIPPADVERVHAALSAPSELYLYEGARHGFNCDQRDSYDAAAATLARTRTQEFLRRWLTAPS